HGIHRAQLQAAAREPRARAPGIPLSVGARARTRSTRAHALAERVAHGLRHPNPRASQPDAARAELLARSVCRGARARFFARARRAVDGAAHACARRRRRTAASGARSARMEVARAAADRGRTVPRVPGSGAGSRWSGYVRRTRPRATARTRHVTFVELPPCPILSHVD